MTTAARTTNGRTPVEERMDAIVQSLTELILAVAHDLARHAPAAAPLPEQPIPRPLSTPPSKTTPKPESWLSVKEAALYARVSVRVIRRAVLADQLGHGRVNGKRVPKHRPSGANYGRIRIKRADIDAWMEGRTRSTARQSRTGVT